MIVSGGGKGVGNAVRGGERQIDNYKKLTIYQFITAHALELERVIITAQHPLQCHIAKLDQ